MFIDIARTHGFTGSSAVLLLKTSESERNQLIRELKIAHKASSFVDMLHSEQTLTNAIVASALHVRMCENECHRATDTWQNLFGTYGMKNLFFPRQPKVCAD